MCKDQATTFLHGLGYNVIRLPRENIRPMTVITAGSRGGSILGDVQQFMSHAGAVPPPISMNAVAADINGKSSSKFKLSIGLGFLDAILKGFGLKGLKLGFAFNHAESISFRFKNVLEDSLDPAALGNYLQTCTPRVDSLLIDSIDDRGEAAIITAIIKSSSFEVAAHDESGGKVDIDIAGIKGVLDVNGSVEVERGADRTVSFAGDRPLAFGFKGFWFWTDLDKGAFQITPPPGGDGNVGPLAVKAGKSGPASPKALFGASPVILRTQ